MFSEFKAERERFERSISALRRERLECSFRLQSSLQHHSLQPPNVQASLRPNSQVLGAASVQAYKHQQPMMPVHESLMSLASLEPPQHHGQVPRRDAPVKDAVGASTGTGAVRDYCHPHSSSHSNKSAGSSSSTSSKAANSRHTSFADTHSEDCIQVVRMEALRIRPVPDGHNNTSSGPDVPETLSYNIVAERRYRKEQTEESIEVLPAVWEPAVEASTPPCKSGISLVPIPPSHIAESVRVLRDVSRLRETTDKETMTWPTRTKSTGVQVTTRDLPVLSHTPEHPEKPDKVVKLKRHPGTHRDGESPLTVSSFVYPVRREPSISYQPGAISSLISPAYSSSVLQTYTEIYRGLSKASRAVLNG